MGEGEPRHAASTRYRYHRHYLCSATNGFVDVELCSQTTGDMTRMRTLGGDRESDKGTPWYHVYYGDKIVLFGHWPASEPRRGKRAIGLDTGCVYGFTLTAYIIETDEFVSVPARRAYDES